MHRLLWEQANGLIPPGHVVVFMDGDRTHIAHDNLELITRGELARRNTIHNLPEDLKEVLSFGSTLQSNEGYGESMPKNRMTDLRNHLFETLEALKDPDTPMDVDRALAVASVAQQLIESAKVEVAFIKATDAAVEGQFFDSPIDEPKQLRRLV